MKKLFLILTLFALTGCQTLHDKIIDQAVHETVFEGGGQLWRLQRDTHVYSEQITEARGLFTVSTDKATKTVWVKTVPQLCTTYPRTVTVADAKDGYTFSMTEGSDELTTALLNRLCNKGRGSVDKLY